MISLHSNPGITVVQATLLSALRCVLLAGILCFPVHSHGAPEDGEPRKLAVITYRQNKTSELTKAELGRMFLKKSTEWADGSRSIPIDQSGQSEIRERFYRTVLDRSLYDMKRYWLQETMTGSAKPPVSLDSSATVKKYVEKIKGSIGYIYEDEIDDSVRVIRVTDMPELYSPKEPENDAKDEPSDANKTP